MRQTRARIPRVDDTRENRATTRAEAEPLAPEDQLSRVSGFNQTVFGLRFVVALAVAGPVVDAVSIRPLYWASALLTYAAR